VYASSLTQRVDLAPADASVDEDFIDDGGRFIFDWVLTSSANAPLSCAQAGAVQVSLDGTLNGALALSDMFPCADGTAITKATVSGTYSVVAMDALNSAGQGLGASSTTKTNQVITKPNGYTDFGTVMILAQ